MCSSQEIIKDYFPEIINDKEDKDEVKEFMKKNNIKNYIMIFPGATTSAKKWPEEKFDELIKKFHKRYPKYKVIISSSNIFT